MKNEKKKDFDEKEIIKLVENFMIVDKKIDIISMMFADYQDHFYLIIFRKLKMMNFYLINKNNIHFNLIILYLLY